MITSSAGRHRSISADAEQSAGTHLRVGETAAVAPAANAECCTGATVGHDDMLHPRPFLKRSCTFRRNAVETLNDKCGTGAAVDRSTAVERVIGLLLHVGEKWVA